MTTTYAVDTEPSWWPGMDQPGYQLTVTDENGYDVCGLQIPDLDADTITAALTEAGYPDATAASKDGSVTVEPTLYDVLLDGSKIGSVVTSTHSVHRKWTVCLDGRLRGTYPTREEAVDAVLAEHAKPQPMPCPTCGAVSA